MIGRTAGRKRCFEHRTDADNLVCQAGRRCSLVVSARRSRFHSGCSPGRSPDISRLRVGAMKPEHRVDARGGDPAVLVQARERVRGEPHVVAAVQDPASKAALPEQSSFSKTGQSHMPPAVPLSRGSVSRPYISRCRLVGGAS